MRMDMILADLFMKLKNVILNTVTQILPIGVLIFLVSILLQLM
jgi:hypothetical protein